MAWIGILMVALGLFVTIRIVLPFSRAIGRAQSETIPTEMQVEDVTSQEPPMSAALQEAERALKHLGFQRALVLKSLVGPARLPVLQWAYRDTSGQVCAQITESKGNAFGVLTTWFPDDTLVETRVPRGPTLDSPDYTVQSAAGFEEAYRLHQARVRQFRATHGGPLEVPQSYDDEWRRRVELHKERYLPRFLNHAIDQSLFLFRGLLALVLPSIVGGIILIIAEGAPNSRGILAAVALATGVIWIGTVFVVRNRMKAWGMLPGSQHKDRGG